MVTSRRVQLSPHLQQLDRRLVKASTDLDRVLLLARQTTLDPSEPNRFRLASQSVRLARTLGDLREAIPSRAQDRSFGAIHLRARLRLLADKLDAVNTPPAPEELGNASGEVQTFSLEVRQLSDTLKTISIPKGPTLQHYESPAADPMLLIGLVAFKLAAVLEHALRTRLLGDNGKSGG